MKRGCTQCGECLNVCPVFRQHFKEEYSPKGKRILLEPLASADSSEPSALSWPDVFEFARLCAGCGRCKTACARKLSTADLLADVRAAHPHWTQRLWELWIKNMGPLWPSIGYLANLVPDTLTPDMLESSIATARALREKSSATVWVRIRPAEQKQNGKIALFSGCTAKNVRPQWTKKAASLLRAFGYALPEADRFGCCGGTMHHAGQYKAMRDMRRTNVSAWRDLGKPQIAVFCASCHHSLSEYGADSFTSPEEAAQWKSNIVPLSSLLHNPTSETTAHVPRQYGYHQPCHWEKDADMAFLKSILPGLHKGEGVCCGMGGILKMTDPDLSASMGKTCLELFPQTVTDIVTGCSGCAMQLSAYAEKSVTVRHWLDIVEDAPIG